MHTKADCHASEAKFHFMLHCRDGGPLEHELKTPMPLAEVNDLRSGRMYRFRVQAFNEVCRQCLLV